MKSYTDLEQSKKLAEILPLESADMFYSRADIALGEIECYANVLHREEVGDDIPAWSLAALLELVRSFQPNYQSALFVGKENGYLYMSSIDSTTHEHNNPIDACYELILKLHEQKIL